MTGYVAMARDWQDHDIFDGDEFSRRDAWAWLIAHAAWRPVKVRIKGETVELARGELCFSQRFMARKWGWTKSRTDRFLAFLRARDMIFTRSKIGATAGHHAGQGQAITTICNYDKFQGRQDGLRGNHSQTSGATAGQRRIREPEEEKRTLLPVQDKPPVRAREADRGTGGRVYAFSGEVIRLSPCDLDRWRTAFHAIPDIDAELTAMDDWLRSVDDASLRKRWFHVVSGSLSKKHQSAVRQSRQDEAESLPIA